MNHYPDNYHGGYGRDASGMQGGPYGGYRDSPAGSHQSHPDYHSGGYPMAPHHGGGGARGMYGQGGPPGQYGMAGYPGPYMSGPGGQHQTGMVNPYYNSHHRQRPGGHPGYGSAHPQPSGSHMHQQHGMGAAGGSGHHQSHHPPMMGGRGSMARQDHYGGAFPGHGSPSRPPLHGPTHSSHPQVPVPPHPMRQTNIHQNPQEVADNILQMASSYPSNQTVQVPLKNRPAPYHIPRSPHYAPRPDHPQQSSPGPHHHQQVQQSSPAVSTSCQTSPSPTASGGPVSSHNPTPPPNAGMLRSPCGQVMSPSGLGQRSPSSVGSVYTGQQASAQTPQQLTAAPTSHPAPANTDQPQHYPSHHQQHGHHPHQSHLVQQSDSPHYSPQPMAQSPYSASPSAQNQGPPYSPHSHSHNPSHLHHHQSNSNMGRLVSSPSANNIPGSYASSPSHIGQGSNFTQGPTEASSNPLMSLEKLVMLPETQVVDPKSVVNDACLSAQSEEGPKNVEDPAEQPAESSGSSVGCSGVSSSPLAQSVDTDACIQSASQADNSSISSQSGQPVATTWVHSDEGAGQSDKSLPPNQPTATASNVNSLSTDAVHCCADSHSQSDCAINEQQKTDTDQTSQTSATSKKQVNPFNMKSNPDDLSPEGSPGINSKSDQIITEDSCPDTSSNRDQTATKSNPSGVDANSDHPFPEVSSGATSNPDQTSTEDSVHCNNVTVHTRSTSQLGETKAAMVTFNSTEISAHSGESEEADCPATQAECPVQQQCDTNLVSSKSNVSTNTNAVKDQVSEHCPVKCDLKDETSAEDQKNVLQENCDKKSSLSSDLSKQAIIYNSVSLCAKTPVKRDLPNQEAFDSPVSLSSSISNSSCTESPNEVSEYERIAKEEDRSLQPSYRNTKVKEEIKLPPVPCRPPTVLSEVPIITNGVGAVAACGTDEDIELDCSGNDIHSKVYNGFGTLVKSKLGFSRRAARLPSVTPCSIAVGASERAVCERFALRRSCVGRITRTSSSRARSDSTGTADSDESLENISSSSYLLSKDPQDGTRKRGPGSSSKRNGFSKSVSVVVSSSTKGADNSSSNAKTSLDKNVSSSHGNGRTSDEHYYYEGVDDSYDVYLNTFSSDESGVSNDGKEHRTRSKQKNSVTSSAEVEKGTDDVVATTTTTPNGTEEKGKKDNQEPEKDVNIKTPPAKRRRASPGSSTTSDLNHTSQKGEHDVVIDLTSEPNTPPVKKQCVSIGKESARSTEKFRPSILCRRSPMKYPIVVLEKSNVISPKILSVKKESSDLISVSEGSTPQQLSCANLPDVKSERTTSPNPKNSASEAGVAEQDKAVVKNEDVDLTQSNISTSPKKNPQKKRPRKKKVSKSKSKGKGREIQTDRRSDVTDSFKSMKFSRTLDLMKASRKREGGSMGPFVRVVGTRSSPNTVSVFAQPTSEVLTAAKQGKLGVGGKKGPQSGATVTTVHMVSNLHSKRPPMVPSTRTISHKPWVCAFCGQPSSYKFMGDLFGPYFKESEVGQAEKLALEESKKQSPGKDPKQQSSGKKGPYKGHGHQPSTSTPSPRNQRRKSALSPRTCEETLPPQPEELWVHQACALWSPGVCLVGNKMYGLDEAVKDAAENFCSVCKSVGAIIGCLHKACPMKYHFFCAVEKDCFMDEENLSLLCPKHKEKKMGSASTSKS